LLLQSCQQGEILQVKGMNFDQLEAKEFTPEEMRLMWNAHDYRDPLYHVYNENGTLWLNLADSNGPGSFALHTYCDILYGVDIGEWGGWLSTGCFGEFSQGIVNAETVLSGESIIGVYQKNPSDPVAYILAGTYRTQRVYRFTDHAEKGWTLETVAQLEIVPYTAFLDGDKLVIAASKELITVDVNTGETTVLYDGEDWIYNQYNSIAKVGDSYFIGSVIGLREYRISEGKMLFYPYPDYVPEEE
jgi:hypothetical protein